MVPVGLALLRVPPPPAPITTAAGRTRVAGNPTRRPENRTRRRRRRNRAGLGARAQVAGSRPEKEKSERVGRGHRLKHMGRAAVSSAAFADRARTHAANEAARATPSSLLRASMRRGQDIEFSVEWNAGPRGGQSPWKRLLTPTSSSLIGAVAAGETEGAVDRGRELRGRRSARFSPRAGRAPG